MKKSTKRLTCILLILIMLISSIPIALTGCGSTEQYATTDSIVASNSMLDYSAGVSESYEANITKDDSYVEEYESPESLMEVSPNRKLVYTYNINAEASDVASTRQSISDRVTELGGYISNDNFYENYDGRESWDAEIRIPTECREDLSGYISEGTRVTRSNVSVDDVTLDYADNEARLNVEKQAYEEYERLLESATSAEELLMIRNEMYDIQANIDSYETTLRYMQNDIDYTKFNIYIEETRLGINEDRNIGSAFIIACQDAVEELLNFFADVIVGIPRFFIGIIILLFYLVLILILIKFLHFVWKKIKKKFNITWKHKSRYEKAAEIFAEAYKASHINSTNEEDSKQS